jgi:hypothetical protein
MKEVFRHIHIHKKSHLRHLTVKKVGYEPSDVHWSVLFEGNWGTKELQYRIKNLLIHICLILFLFFISSPAAALAAIRFLIVDRIFHIKVENVRRMSGILGDIIFEYISSLLIYMSARCISIFISFATKKQRFESLSRYRRLMFIRKLFYFLLSTLAIPALMLTSLDGIIKYFQSGSSFQHMLARLFLADTGALFINYLIQNSLLKNTSDLLRTEDTFWYLLNRVLKKTETPYEKIRAAELLSFGFESEYAKILSIVAIGLSFCLFSPLILIGFHIYLLIKYYVDRYQIQYLYSHRINLKDFYKREYEDIDIVDHCDFVAHTRNLNILIKGTVIVLAIFIFVVLLFFATKLSRNNLSLFPHLIICYTILLLVLGLFIFIHWKGIRLNRDLVADTEREDVQSVLREAYDYRFAFPYLVKDLNQEQKV